MKMAEASRENIHEAFNARFLRPENIGSTFVSSPFLANALLPRHTAIIGPRGSGKTTLLKMLTLPALLRWQGTDRDETLYGLDFVAVYIAASLTWSANFRSFSGREIGTEIEKLLSVSLFRHHTMLALIDTWSDMRDPLIGADSVLQRFYLEAGEHVDTSFIRALSNEWGLKIATSTKGGVVRAVKARIRDLQRLAVRAAHNASDPKDMLNDNADLADNFLDDAGVFIDLIEEFYSCQTKLALCFDEVEITSAAVARVIVSSTRSIDQRILIKYSAAPYVGIAVEELLPHAPSQDNDFQLLFLTTFASKDTKPFSESLFRSLVARQGSNAAPDHLLGQSLIDEFDRVDLDKYGPGGLYQRRFQLLWNIDASFRLYSELKGIDPKDLKRGDESQRAADVRKIIWPVVIRSELLFANDAVEQKPQRRLRSKSAIADCYTGATSLFAICEGNPRWLIGLMEPLLHQLFVSAGNQVEMKLRRSAQKRALEKMIASYFALLSTVPSSERGHGMVSLVELVERVGNFFKNSLLSPKFNADPVMSFTIDNACPTSVKEMIGRGINLGAFISTQHKSGPEGYRVGDLIGLKIRLSNIFAPYFNLPLIGGRTVSLSTILDRTRPRSGERLVADLFEGLQ